MLFRKRHFMCFTSLIKKMVFISECAIAFLVLLSMVQPAASWSHLSPFRTQRPFAIPSFGSGLPYKGCIAMVGETSANDEASGVEMNPAFSASNDEDGCLRLRIIQLNDVYKLDNFPHFKTLVDVYTNDEPPPDKTIVILAGDFLGPSLLSSLDRGRGFVDVMSASGVTHVCFGNHETDIPIEALPERIAESSFVWLNSNMRELDENIGVTTPSCDVVTVEKCVKGDKPTCTKTVALLGLLTDDESLYRVGRFADATIEPVADSTERMLQELEQRQPKVDLVVPVTHQSMTCDEDFANRFTGKLFPVVVGGHDHEVYDEVHSQCRIIKTGMDAVNTAIIDIDWPLSSIFAEETRSDPPKVSVQMVPTQSFPPDAFVQQRVHQHLCIVRDLEMAKLFRIDCDETKDPFTTAKNRIRPTNGSVVLTTAIRKGMRAQCGILNAGCIRGGKTYKAEWFTWSDLKCEIPFSTEITTLQLPGRVLCDTISYSRRGSYEQHVCESGGYMQTCDMIHYDDNSRSIVSIRGEPFDPDEMYLTAVPVATLNGMDNNVPLLEWAAVNTGHLHEDAGLPAKLAIVELFSAVLWLKLGAFADIDMDKDGVITPEELKAHVQKVFGRDFAELAVANFMAVADVDGEGYIKPCEMLMTQFIASDMMYHVCTGQENDVMIRLASELMCLPPSHPKIEEMVRALRQKIDTKRDGRITREEAIEALGKVKSREILS